MVISSIAGFVATNLASYFLNKGFDYLFTDRASLEKELNKAIQNTINQYEKKFPCEDKEGKYVFWKSQTIVDELLKYRVMKHDEYDVQKLNDELTSDTRIIHPTKAELDFFFELFVQNVNDNSLLKKLEIEETFKNEIFIISKAIGQIDIKIDDIGEKIEDIQKYIKKTPKSRSLNFIPTEDVTVEIVFEQTPSRVTNYHSIYINRNCDKELIERIHNDQMVVVTGSSLSGKTRMLFNLIQKELTDSYFLFIRNDFNVLNVLNECEYDAEKKYYIILDDINKISDLAKKELLQLLETINQISSINKHNCKVLATCSDFEWQDIDDSIKRFFQDSQIKIPKLKKYEFKQYVNKLKSFGISPEEIRTGNTIGHIFVDVERIKKECERLHAKDISIQQLFKGISLFSIWKGRNKGCIRLMADFLKFSYDELIKAANLLSQPEYDIANINLRKSESGNLPDDIIIDVEEYIVDEIIHPIFFNKREVESKIDPDIKEVIIHSHKIDNSREKLIRELQYVIEILNYDLSFETATKLVWRTKYFETKKFIIDSILYNKYKNNWFDNLKSSDTKNLADSNDYSKRFISAAIFFSSTFGDALEIYEQSRHSHNDDDYQLANLIYKITDPTQINIIEQYIGEKDRLDFVYINYISKTPSWENALSYFYKIIDRYRVEMYESFFFGQLSEYEKVQQRKMLKRTFYALFKRIKDMDELNQVVAIIEEKINDFDFLAEWKGNVLEQMPVNAIRTVIEQMERSVWLDFLFILQQRFRDDHRLSIYQNHFLVTCENYEDALMVFQKIDPKDAFTYTIMLDRPDCSYDNAKEIFIYYLAPQYENSEFFEVSEIFLNILLKKAINSTEYAEVISLYNKYGHSLERTYTIQAILDQKWLKSYKKAKDIIQNIGGGKYLTEHSIASFLKKEDMDFKTALSFFNENYRTELAELIDEKIRKQILFNSHLWALLFSTNIHPDDKQLAEKIFKYVNEQHATQELYGRYIQNPTLINNYDDAIAFIYSNNVLLDKYIIGNLLKLLRKERGYKRFYEKASIAKFNNLIISNEDVYLTPILNNHRIELFLSMSEKQECFIGYDDAGMPIMKEYTISEFIDNLGENVALNVYVLNKIFNVAKANSEEELHLLLKYIIKSDIKIDNKFFFLIKRKFEAIMNDEILIKLKSVWKKELDNKSLINDIRNDNLTYLEALALVEKENTSSNKVILSTSFWNSVLKKLSYQRDNSVFNEGLQIYNEYIKDKLLPSQHTFVSILALANTSIEMEQAIKIFDDYNKKLPEKDRISANSHMYTSQVRVAKNIEEAKKILLSTHNVEFELPTYNVLLDKYCLLENETPGVYKLLLDKFCDSLKTGIFNISILLGVAIDDSEKKADTYTYNTIMKVPRYTDLGYKFMLENVKPDIVTFCTRISTVDMNENNAFEKIKNIVIDSYENNAFDVSVFEYALQRVTSLQQILDLLDIYADYNLIYPNFLYQELNNYLLKEEYREFHNSIMKSLSFFPEDISYFVILNSTRIYILESIKNRCSRKYDHFHEIISHIGNTIIQKKTLKLETLCIGNSNSFLKKVNFRPRKDFYVVLKKHRIFKDIDFSKSI